MVSEKLNAILIRALPRRAYVQATFLLLWLDPLNLRLHNICGPVFHCYSCPLALFACPIGVIANFSALHIFPFVAVGFIILVALLIGSLFCGWACPFGLLQDLASKISRPRLRLPGWMTHFRYVVLALTVILIPALFGIENNFSICMFCPAGALEGAIPLIGGQILRGGEFVWMNPVKTGVLVAFLVSIFFIKRPWCRVLCPLGALLTLFNKISFIGVSVDKQNCTACGKCHSLCDIAVDPDLSPNSAACIRCLECAKCPSGAISLQTHFDK